MLLFVFESIFEVQIDWIGNRVTGIELTKQY